MVVRGAVLILATLMTHDLQRAVGNHLVGIHVDRSAGTALYHVGRELVVHLAVDYLATCLCDSGMDLVVDDAEFVVSLHGCQLDVGHRNDVLREVGHLEVADLVIVDTALRLHTIVCFGGYLQSA